MKVPSLSTSGKISTVATADALHQLAFDHSLLPHIISVVGTGQLFRANTATYKLLGYRKNELLGLNREQIFDMKDGTFKEMLKQRTATGHSIAKVSLINKNGRLLPCEITSAVFLDNDGIELSITTIVDRRQGIVSQKNIDAQKETIVAQNIVLALQKSNDRIAESNQWLQMVAKTSYDVMWDYDVRSNTVWVGESIKEVFGYVVPNNEAACTLIATFLTDEEKGPFIERLNKTLASGKKIWKDSCMIKRQDGSLVATTSRAGIIRDKKGNAIRLIGATQDVSKLKELEKNLKEKNVAHEELTELFHEASKLSFEGRWDWNLLTDEFVLGEGFKKIFGHSVHEAKGNFAEAWSDYLHPDDKEAVIKGLQTALNSTATQWEQLYRFVCSDGSIAHVLNRASIIRQENGKACRMLGAMQDVSRLKLLEAKLEQEIDIKTRQIADASREAREAERSDIGKELHDNVNQLLGASQLYMEMAMQEEEDTAMLLSRSSKYTQTAIEAIRKLTQGLMSDMLTNLGLREAMDNIVRDTMEIHPVKITCTMTAFRENKFNNKFKMTVFRIVQEQLNNIIKHAKASAVTINLKQNKLVFLLSIEDNGVGFDVTKNCDGIGLANIRSRAMAYNGSAEFTSLPGAGCLLHISFLMSELLLNAVPKVTSTT